MQGIKESMQAEIARLKTEAEESLVEAEFRASQEKSQLQEQLNQTENDLENAEESVADLQ